MSLLWLDPMCFRNNDIILFPIPLAFFLLLDSLCTHVQLAIQYYYIVYRETHIDIDKWIKSALEQRQWFMLDFLLLQLYTRRCKKSGIVARTLLLLIVVYVIFEINTFSVIYPVLILSCEV